MSALWRGKRLLILYGSSGVGKTSLVHAGVISRFNKESVNALPFNQESADLLPVGRISHSYVLHATDLPQHNPYDLALLSSWSPDKSLNELIGLSPAEFLAQRPVRTDRYGDPLPVLVAIDQFEEIFTEPPYRQHRIGEFVDHLADAMKRVPSLRLLISIREEALANLLSYDTRLAGHSRARFRLLPLAREAALEAVTKPLAGTRRSFAPGVAERLVGDVLTTEVSSRAGRTTELTLESVDPMRLQVVCTALWRALPEDVTTITEEHLRQHGDIRTVTEFCTRIVAEVADEHQIKERTVSEWLEQAFITKGGARRAAYEGVSETGGMPNPIARALKDRGLLKSMQRAGSRWYELQHDRLIEIIRKANHPLAEGEGVFGTSPAKLLRTAEAALADGHLEFAVEHAVETLDKCGGDDLRIRAEAESFLANIAFRSGDLTVAEEHFLRAAEVFETLQDKAAVGRVFARIGQLLLARRPYADAVDALQAAVTRLPGDVEVSMDLARALWSSGELRAAAAVFGQVLTIAPDTVEALALRGQILVELNDDSAFQDLDNLPRLQSDDIGRRADVRAARALALARQRRIEEALPEADAAVDAAPDSGPVLLCAAGVAHVAGDPTRTSRLLHRAQEAQAPRLLPHQREMADRLLAAAA